MGNLPLASVIPQLAQMMRAQIASYAQRGIVAPQQNPPAPPQNFVGEQPNPVGGPQVPQPPAVDLPEASSISGLLRQKQAARANLMK